jgi:hypothetical protein
VDDGKRDGWEGIGHAGISFLGKSGMPTSSGMPGMPSSSGMS